MFPYNLYNNDDDETEDSIVRAMNATRYDERIAPDYGVFRRVERHEIRPRPYFPRVERAR